MSLFDRWRVTLDRLCAEGRFRTLAQPAGLDFSSNDYLGYTKLQHKDAIDLSRSGAASRLLRGEHPIWSEVETRLAQWHGAEAALVLPSGYAANEGLLATLLEPGDVVFSDQLNHASIIDGIRLSRADKEVFLHNDLADLETRLVRRRAERKPGEAWFIVTESLFGMEGDFAPLAQLANLAERHDAHLIVDEAHATGCFGEHGGGLVDAAGLRGRILASVHTGGKALAVPGAYIVGLSLLKDLLVNRCRHLIFTTALPPQIGGWWLEMLDRVPGDQPTRDRLHANVRAFREAAESVKIRIGGNAYIATVPIGDDADAMRAATRLQSLGYDIRAIRPPTVPIGTARLRISIHADHEEATLRELASVLPESL
ncbi:MAG: 8-amino-7-oxononanoate synthase [Gemmataceae bacterium]|nr:8-amino-7-oxononanoate synthase [Gemmataceae bacterium]